MSGGCDTSDEDRERWRREGIAREEADRTNAAEIQRVAALLPPEHEAAKRYLEGFAAGLRHRKR